MPSQYFIFSFSFFFWHLALPLFGSRPPSISFRHRSSLQRMSCCLSFFTWYKSLYDLSRLLRNFCLPTGPGVMQCTRLTIFFSFFFSLFGTAFSWQPSSVCYWHPLICGNTVPMTINIIVVSFIGLIKLMSLSNTSYRYSAAVKNIQR